MGTQESLASQPANWGSWVAAAGEVISTVEQWEAGLSASSAVVFASRHQGRAASGLV